MQRIPISCETILRMRYAMLEHQLNDLEVFQIKLKVFVDKIDFWKRAAQEGAPFVAHVFDSATNIARLNNMLEKL